MLSELENYQLRIEDLHGQIRNLIAGLPVEALNWRPTEGADDHATNSLAVLAAHVAGSEHFWIGEVVGHYPPTRDRDAEFLVQAGSAAELVTLLDQVGQETSQVFANLTESVLNETRQVNEREVSIRWAMLHVVDHTAVHLGHMQITYQLWMNGQAAQSPRWYDRLPGNG